MAFRRPPSRMRSMMAQGGFLTRTAASTLDAYATAGEAGQGESCWVPPPSVSTPRNLDAGRDLGREAPSGRGMVDFVGGASAERRSTTLDPAKLGGAALKRMQADDQDRGPAANRPGPDAVYRKAGSSPYTGCLAQGEERHEPGFARPVTIIVGVGGCIGYSLPVEPGFSTASLLQADPGSPQRGAQHQPRQRDPAVACSFLPALSRRHLPRLPR